MTSDPGQTHHCPLCESHAQREEGLRRALQESLDALSFEHEQWARGEGEPCTDADPALACTIRALIRKHRAILDRTALEAK